MCMVGWSAFEHLRVGHQFGLKYLCVVSVACGIYWVRLAEHEWAQSLCDVMVEQRQQQQWRRTICWHSVKSNRNHNNKFEYLRQKCTNGCVTSCQQKSSKWLFCWWNMMWLLGSCIDSEAGITMEKVRCARHRVSCNPLIFDRRRRSVVLWCRALRQRDQVLNYMHFEFGNAST